MEINYILKAVITLNSYIPKYSSDKISLENKLKETEEISSQVNCDHLGGKLKTQIISIKELLEAIATTN